jgi:murein hydrolase activator
MKPRRKRPRERSPRRPVQREAAQALLILRVLLLALACYCASTACAPSKEELRDLRARIEQLQQQLEDSEETRSEAADALRESETAISATNRRLRELAGEQREIRAALKQLNADSATLEASIAFQQTALAKLLHQQYLVGQPEALRLLLNRQDPNQMARDLHYLGYVTRARAELLTRLRGDLTELQTKAQQTARNAQQLQSVQREESTQRSRLEKQRLAHKVALQRASGQIARQRKQISTFKRDEQRLSKLLERLAQLKPQKNGLTKPAHEPVPDQSQFGRQKGTLRLPVSGTIVNRFGAPRADGAMSWKGVFVAATAGQEVHAVAAGRVVYADWLRGFGNLIIVDHGDGYMSLYGNNESVLKQAGEDIQAGEVIAIVGASGGNPDSGLYFEFRYQGKPFDPLPWVARK